MSDYIPTSLLRNLPFFSSLPDNPIISRILRSLIDNLEIGEDDDFDVGDFLEDLFDTVFRAIARLFGRNNDIVECIVDVVESLVDQDAVRRLNFRLQQVRRAITALMRIGRFLNREHSSLSDARILQECVELFVNLSFCDRCVQKTPPLCFSTCNALVRGCYSPFYTALNPQYSQLWVEVQRIINILNDTVGDVLSDEIELLDSSALVPSSLPLSPSHSTLLSPSSSPSLLLTPSHSLSLPPTPHFSLFLPLPLPLSSSLPASLSLSLNLSPSFHLEHSLYLSQHNNNNFVIHFLSG